ncbi:type II secretion system F family protein [Thermaerobacter subterraneus]|uniref:Flp pilus assembly protein TadB n=1 Tax=Thermaerobacter subterraneus DSM 13965 TaxID=867903 RepID=K6NY41_9FIRM|nr:type II secretion system F family protein [Thermaerobacter subterraneus]EKP93795.1 Flp pilus assembly protein TadB [Thermaerobacter subterraneus DSM 13965]
MRGFWQELGPMLGDLQAVARHGLEAARQVLVVAGDWGFWLLLGVFLGSTYLVWGLLQAWDGWRGARVARRLEAVHRHSRQRGLRLAPMLAMEDVARTAREARSWRQQLVERAEARLRGTRWLDGVQRKLNRARLRWRAVEFVALQAGAGLAGGLLGLAMGGRWPLALAATVAGILLPDAYLARRYQQRLRAFDGQLPDALTLMANALKSGYSFLQAADVVAREMPPPIADEFAWLVKETRVNIPLEDALANLLDRVPSADLDLVVTAVLIQKQVGGNLAGVLERTAETIRERVRLQGQIRTLTAQGRLSGWIVGALPVALLVLLSAMNPAYLQPLLATPLGWTLLGAGVVMEAAGVLVIRALIRVDV